MRTAGGDGQYCIAIETSTCKLDQAVICCHRWNGGDEARSSMRLSRSCVVFQSAALLEMVISLMLTDIHILILHVGKILAFKRMRYNGRSPDLICLHAAVALIASSSKTVDVSRGITSIADGFSINRVASGIEERRSIR
jgi:hypothetical protein